MRSNSPQRAINKSCREAQARGGRNFSAEKYSVYFDEKVKKKITKSDVVFQNSEQGREEKMKILF